MIRLLLALILFCAPAFADLTAKVGAFNLSTAVAGNTQAITGVGFEPKLVIFWYSGGTETIDDLSGGSYFTGLGVMTGATSRWTVSAKERDAVTTTDASRYHDAAAAISIPTEVGAGIDGLMDFSSFDADGFTLVIDDAFASAHRVGYLALGGSDITDLKAGSFTANTVTGNQAVTGVGFQPDFVLFGTVSLSIAPPDPQVEAILSIGAATSSTSRAVVAIASDSGLTTSDTNSYALDIETLADVFTDVRARADFVSMDADGFTINWLEALGSAAHVFYLALKGGQYSIFSDVTKTTLDTIPVSGFGFAPTAAMVLSHNRTESTQNVAQADLELSIGAATSPTERFAAWVSSKDAVTTSVISHASENDEIYINANDTTLEGLMDVQSFDSDGITFVMDDADPSANFFWGWAIGPTAVGAAFPGGIINNPQVY